jgi:DNA-binding transcriptional ArsR family regulator
MPLRTLQVVFLGGIEDAVFVGLRNFPAHKVTLVTLDESLNQANQLASRLTDSLRLAVEIVKVPDANIRTILETVRQIRRREAELFQDFIINIGSANKHLTCAGVTAAFVLGIKAFDVIDDQPLNLPIMRLAYTQAISEPKMKILCAIQQFGGEVESLEKLSVLSNYGKPLLSYHIRGSEDSQGLEDLGLVDVERGKRGRLRVRLTGLGRTLLSSSVMNSV